MKTHFEKWLLEQCYSNNQAKSYVSAIGEISQDLSEKMKTEIDVFKVDNLFIVAKISELYDETGGFFELGDKYNGVVRNSIRKYFEFLTKI